MGKRAAVSPVWQNGAFSELTDLILERLIKIVEHGAVDAVAGLLVEQLGATSKKEAMRKSAMAIKKYFNAQK